jgi:hypothetical protein
LNIWLPLISGFVGALIGGAASIITMVVQSRAQSRRERLQAALALALEDRRVALQILVQVQH